MPGITISKGGQLPERLAPYCFLGADYFLAHLIFLQVFSEAYAKCIACRLWRTAVVNRAPRCVSRPFGLPSCTPARSACWEGAGAAMLERDEC